MNKKLIFTIAAVVGIITSLLMPATASADPAVIEVWPGDSIQTAVDNAKQNDTILVHTGAYHQSVIVSTNGITLRGEAGTILVGAGPADEGTTLLRDGIILDGVRRVTVECFEITEYLSTDLPLFGKGITVRPGSSHNLIQDNKLITNQAGIAILGGTKNQVVRNKVIGSWRIGIDLISGSSSNLVQKNDISDSGIQFEGIGRGIGIGGSNNQVIENKVVSSTMQGIILFPMASGNLVQDNHVSGTLCEPGAAGIRIDGTNNHVLKNTVINSCSGGITLFGTASNNIVQNNNISDSGAGVVIDGTKNQVLDNNVTNTAEMGIVIGWYDSSTENLVQGNNISHCGLTSGFDGISISYGFNNQVLDNRIENSGMNGIGLYGLSSGNLIRNNYVSDSECNGIAALGYAGGNTITENRVQDSGTSYYDLYDSIYPPGNTWLDNKYETRNW
jgi:parallel beta-helix repeat protein